jgi:hypothetical protein
VPRLCASARGISSGGITLLVTFAAVQVQDYCGRGAEYVTKLFEGIRRHAGAGVNFVCVTDAPETVPNWVGVKNCPPGIKGWWAKISLFKPGMFDLGERIVAIDLDTIITGDLSEIAGYDGCFAGIRDFYYPARLQSAIMAWEAGSLNHIWTAWDEGGRLQFDPRGDQCWIEKMQPEPDFFQDFAPGQIVSFKADCWRVGRVPEGARVVCFHGRPRPHECQARFIRDLWR